MGDEYFEQVGTQRKLLQGLDESWQKVSILLQDSETITSIADYDGTEHENEWRNGMAAAEELYHIYHSYDLSDPDISMQGDQHEYVVEATYTEKDGNHEGELRLIGKLPKL